MLFPPRNWEHTSEPWELVKALVDRDDSLPTRMEGLITGISMVIAMHVCLMWHGGHACARHLAPMLISPGTPWVLAAESRVPTGYSPGGAEGVQDMRACGADEHGAEGRHALMPLLCGMGLHACQRGGLHACPCMPNEC